ncbi:MULTISPECIES: MarR family winged helix-turn-helix transcriptional regulator [Clostridium]|uniref:MarR family winged helix-turn-helix transcriptional regulator n=1 Tax=Clostridium TaxID=1485 RepID=UPI00069FAE3A|nr:MULTISPECIES: MarR family winged helix-turn-helix transcriptional regulator [Clostridium]KOF55714.1 MarR family transcriptional regulator [Clostridium sp. DMHC 10]MCD2346816.1 MarR family winged helix-turn-helix transcriptional regulator [Clostridium guangxiense]
MDNNTSTLIKLTNGIYRCTQVYLDKRLCEINLTTGTYPYLFVLDQCRGISQNDISRELSVDKAMSARTVKKLIELGYVRKEENKEDVRAYKLYITDKGKSLIPEIHKIVQEWINILVEGNNEDEVKTSIKFLEDVLKKGKAYKATCCKRRK